MLEFLFGVVCIFLMKFPDYHIVRDSWRDVPRRYICLYFALWSGGLVSFGWTIFRLWDYTFIAIILGLGFAIALLLPLGVTFIRAPSYPKV